MSMGDLLDLADNYIDEDVDLQRKIPIQQVLVQTDIVDDGDEESDEEGEMGRLLE